jgi:hypothetical protein
MKTPHRILHAIPRDFLFTTITELSGKDRTDGVSPLLNMARTMGINPLDSGAPVHDTIWLSPLFVSTHEKTTNRGIAKTGSVYGTREFFKLDPDISTGDDALDSEHLRYFTAQAKEAGINVLGDLVLNHVASDHPAFLEEYHKIKEIKEKSKNIEIIVKNGSVTGLRYQYPEQTEPQILDLKFKYHTGDLNDPDCINKADFLTLYQDGSLGQTWADVAKINYESQAARDYFIGTNEKKGLWRQVIDWHLNHGFNGFRCDAAYKIPQFVWKDLIDYTRNHSPHKNENAIYLAETLGGKKEDYDTNLKDTGFNLGMSMIYDWNLREGWPANEIQNMTEITAGAAVTTDNHDCISSLFNNIAEMFKRHSIPQADLLKTTAQACVRNYALSAILSTTTCMENGWQYGLPASSVFKEENTNLYGIRQQQAHERSDLDHSANMSRAIWEINNFKDQLWQKYQSVPQFLSAKEIAPHVIQYECKLYNPETKQEKGKLIVLANEKPEFDADRKMDIDNEEAIFNLKGLFKVYYKPLTPAPSSAPTPSYN